MVDKLIHWSVRNRAAILAAGTLFTIFGVYTTLQMPVDVFPDLTAPTVTVITEAHGMAPTEVENLITFPNNEATSAARRVDVLYSCWRWMSGKATSRATR